MTRPPERTVLWGARLLFLLIGAFGVLDGEDRPAVVVGALVVVLALGSVPFERPLARLGAWSARVLPPSTVRTPASPTANALHGLLVGAGALMIALLSFVIIRSLAAA